MGDNDNQQQSPAGDPPGEGEKPTTFEGWLEGQEDEIKTLVTGHIGGLKSALASEREQRKEFEKKLREAASELEQGSEARKKLEGIAGELEISERRATFYEEAHAAGVTNLRLAWLAVQNDENLLDRRGQVDLERMKKGYPELFGRPKASSGNAGAGTTSPPKPGSGMNEFIRTAAGRPPG